MATMNISLPDEMKAWVEAQVNGGRYANVSDFVRDIIRREQERAKFVAWIEAEAAEGIASGFSEVDLDELYAEITANQDA